MELPKIHAFGSPTVDSAPVLILILGLGPAVVLILILIAHHTETSFPIAVRPYYGPEESGLYKNFVPPPEYFPVA